jgi:hypothetical protein
MPSRTGKITHGRPVDTVAAVDDLDITHNVTRMEEFGD